MSIKGVQINITGMNKAKILAALYNAARPQGMGLLHYTPEDMTEAEAAELLKQGTYFDYLKGRVMKVDLSKNELYVALYDRDNGNGAAEAAIRGAI